MENIGIVILSLSAKHEKFLVGDFSATQYTTSADYFCDICSFKNSIKEPTCFKNPHKMKCTYFIMTNLNRIVWLS